MKQKIAIKPSTEKMKKPKEFTTIKPNFGHVYLSIFTLFFVVSV